jgi:hypothetical protein
MKKKRFYDNKHRNQKWTEKPTGRKIYFADKYITDSSDDNVQTKKPKKPFFTKSNIEKIAKGLIIAVCSFIIIGVGYTVMDIYIDRNAMPLVDTSSDDTANMSNISIDVRGVNCQPLSLDAGIMLDAVIDTTFDNGYSSLVFDLKRDDGTIGYESELATISSYGAVSSPSNDLAGSIEILNNNDILPVGRISCYKDNVVPSADYVSALYDNGALYKDSAGNTYLNPNNDNTYSYIKSIVDEALGLGVSVFLLDNYDIPSDVSGDYDDGYDELALKLYDDFGDKLKLFKAVDINISSNTTNDIEEEWEKKTQDINIDDNKTVVCITANDPTMVKQFLDNRGMTNYIIFE